MVSYKALNTPPKKKQRLKEKLHLGKQDDLNAFFKTNPLYLSIQKNKL